MPHRVSAALAMVLLVLGAVATRPAAAAPPDAEAYAAHAEALEAHLERHVLSRWYPRAVDPSGRGFVQRFDEAWRPGDDGERSIVYQARLTWLASAVAMHDAGRREAYLGYADHGLRFLRETMWDAEHGGFHWAVGADDRPMPDRGGDKHVYGIAFGIYAAATHHAASGSPEALDLAQRAFRWLETHAHDAEHGGYHEALTVAGEPLIALGTTRHGLETDAIGTWYGFRSMNSHIHLLEAFTALYRVWPDALVRERLAEVFEVVRDRIVVDEVGCQHLYFTRDWQAVPGVDSFGHDVETAFLLVEAAEALGLGEDARTHAVARRLVDHALAYGWDREHGGFVDHGPVFGPTPAGEKVWWVQAEGLNALLLMHRLHEAGSEAGAGVGEAGAGAYWAAFERAWGFIERHQVDGEHGGWRPEVAHDGTPTPGMRKSDGWTDGYHQGRALLEGMAALRALSSGGTRGTLGVGSAR